MLSENNQTPNTGNSAPETFDSDGKKVVDYSHLLGARIKRIDPALESPEIASVLAKITTDFQGRLQKDSVNPRAIGVQGSTASTGVIAKEIKNVSVPNTLPQQLANIFFEVIREGKKVHPKDSQSVVEIMRTYGNAYCPCAEKCCPSVLRTTLDVFPLVYLHQGMVSPEERFPEPSKLEEWCTSLFSVKFDALIAGLMSQLNEPLTVSEAGTITRYEIVQDIVQMEKSMIEMLSTLRFAPSVPEIKAQRNASIVGLAATVVTDCPDPLRGIRDLQPLRNVLKTLQDEVRSEKNPFMKSCHKLEVELLEKYIKQLEDRLTTGNSKKKATSDVFQVSQQTDEKRSVETVQKSITKQEIISRCQDAFANAFKNPAVHPAYLRIISTLTNSLPDTIDQSSYESLFGLSQCCVAAGHRIFGLDIPPAAKQILNEGRSLDPNGTGIQPIESQLEESRAAEVNMQQVFIEIQERLGIATVDRNDFYQKIQPIVLAQRRTLKVDGKQNYISKQETEVIVGANSFDNFVKEFCNAMPERIDILQARQMCHRYVSVFKSHGVTVRKSNPTLSTGYFDGADELEIQFKQLLEAFPKNSRSERAAEKAETVNRSITQQEIRDLCIAEIDKTLGSEATSIHDFIDSTLTDCPDVIDQRSYGKLLKLSQMCLAHSMRIAQLDLDNKTKRIMSTDSEVELLFSLPSKTLIENFLKIEQAMQEAFVKIQKRLGLQTVDTLAFREKVRAIVKDCGAEMNPETLERSHQTLAVLAKIRAVSELDLEIWNSFPDRLDVLQAGQLCAVTVLSNRGQVHLVKKMNRKEGQRSERAMGPLEVQLDTLLAQEFPQTSEDFHREAKGAEVMRRSMTKDEIIALCIREMSATSLKSSLLALDQRTLPSLLEQCPEVIDETSYQQLVKLSRLCLNTSIRIQSTDFDPDIKKSLNGGVDIPEARVHPDNLDECRQRELAYQSVFFLIQERLNIHTVDSTQFNAKIGTLMEEVMGSMDVISERPTKRNTRHIPDVEALMKYSLSYWESLPQRLDVLQARRVCEDVLNRALTENEIIRKILPRHVVNSATVASDLRMKFDELLDAEFPFTVDTGLEGVEPISSQELLELFMAKKGELVAAGAIWSDAFEEHFMQQVELRCPKTINSVEDLRPLMSWLLGMAIGSSMTWKSMEEDIWKNPYVNPLLNIYAPVFQQIGQRFGDESFGLNLFFIKGHSSYKGSLIASAELSELTVQAFDTDYIRPRVDTLLEGKTDGLVLEARLQLEGHFSELRRVLPLIIQEYLEHDQHSEDDLIFLSALIKASVDTIHEEFVMNSQYFTGTQFHQFFSSVLQRWMSYCNDLRKKMLLSQTQGTPKDGIDTPAWHANKTLAHPLPQGAEPTWESAKLTAKQLKTDVQNIYTNAKDIPKNLLDTLEIDGGIFGAYMDQIDTFRTVARKAIADLTTDGPINTLEQYEQLVAGFGHAVDSVSIEPLKQYFATQLREWFTTVEMISRASFARAFNEELGSVPSAEDREALEVLLGTPEADACFKAAEAFYALLPKPKESRFKDAVSVQEATTFIRQLREACTAFTQQLMTLDLPLGASISVQYELAFWKLEISMNLAPSSTAPNDVN